MLPGKLVASEQGFGAANAGYFDDPVKSGFRPDVWQRWTLELDARGSTALIARRTARRTTPPTTTSPSRFCPDHALFATLGVR
jgi:hypothetical protein